ncbi:hypothetical protein, partial [Allorhizobium terrae]|uniref:hypothetical protein n=1 Tax=Allorhizobium terrae TaxID=1848972 RepID=UPI001AEEA261
QSGVLISKRDRHCLLSAKASLLPPTQNRRPRFSFFSSSIVKELTVKTVKKSPQPNRKARSSNSKSYPDDFNRAKSTLPQKRRLVR